MNVCVEHECLLCVHASVLFFVVVFVFCLSDCYFMLGVGVGDHGSFLSAEMSKRETYCWVRMDQFR